MNVGNSLREANSRGDLFALLAINEINKKELVTPLFLSKDMLIL
jgi:hypothetical protein